MPGGWELIVIVAVLLLLFGAKKLPDMARSVGQSARVFKGEMKGLKDDETPKDAEDKDTATGHEGPTAGAQAEPSRPALPAGQPSTAEQARSGQPGRGDTYR